MGLGLKRFMVRKFYEYSEEAAIRYYAIKQFRKKFHRMPVLDPRVPATFNDKICQLKICGTDPNLPLYSDKVLAKDIFGKKIGYDHIIPTIWHGTDLVELARLVETMETPYVVKANHGSSMLLFVRDPRHADREAILSTCAGWLSAVFGRCAGERLYLHIEPQILVEPYIGERDVLPVDYKFFVFHGVAHFIHVVTDRASEAKGTFFDRAWNRQRLSIEMPSEPRAIEKPAAFEQMIDIAETIGAKFDFVRVDLYEIDGNPLFGEATFYPDSGLVDFTPHEYDDLFGRLWDGASA